MFQRTMVRAIPPSSLVALAAQKFTLMFGGCFFFFLLSVSLALVMSGPARAKAPLPFARAWQEASPAPIPGTLAETRFFTIARLEGYGGKRPLGSSQFAPTELTLGIVRQLSPWVRLMLAYDPFYEGSRDDSSLSVSSTLSKFSINYKSLKFPWELEVKTDKGISPTWKPFFETPFESLLAPGARQLLGGVRWRPRRGTEVVWHLGLGEGLILSQPGGRSTKFHLRHDLSKGFFCEIMTSLSTHPELSDQGLAVFSDNGRLLAGLFMDETYAPVAGLGLSLMGYSSATRVRRRFSQPEVEGSQGGGKQTRYGLNGLATYDILGRWLIGLFAQVASDHFVPEGEDSLWLKNSQWGGVLGMRFGDVLTAHIGVYKALRDPRTSFFSEGSSEGPTFHIGLNAIQGDETQ